MNARARIPIAFPNNPAIGDQFTASSGVMYEWDGTVWFDVVPPPVPFVEVDPLSVKLVGDTMTGALTIPQVPTVAGHAASKGYVDQLVTNIVGIAAYCGAADGSTADCQCQFTALSGHPNGPLPPANQFVSGEHLIVARGGNPTQGPAAGFILAAGDWLISDATTWYVMPFGGASVLASTVAVTPIVAAGDDVQEVLENLQAQKVNKAGDTVTGVLTFQNGAVGRVQVRTGSATQTGYLEFFTAEGTRRGYLGYKGAGNTLVHVSENGWSWEFPQALGGNLTINPGQLYIDRAANTVGIRLRKTDNNANVSTPSIEFTANDGRIMGALVGLQLAGTGYYGTWPSEMRCEVGSGGFGRQTCWTTRQQSGGFHSLRVQGDVFARGVQLSSDVSRKSNIQPLGAEAVNAAFAHLNPVQFHWQPVEVDHPLAAPHGKMRGPDDDPDSVNWGFIADDIEQGAPDLVEGERGSKTYNLAGVVAVLVAKIKELEARLAANGL